VGGLSVLAAGGVVCAPLYPQAKRCVQQLGQAARYHTNKQRFQAGLRVVHVRGAHRVVGAGSCRVGGSIIKLCWVVDGIDATG
jgi:hypothetical protein